MPIVTREELLRLEQVRKNPDSIKLAGKKVLCQRKLIDFMEAFWHVLHPGKQLKRGWALEAICDHLEGVTAGHIKHLLINVPPGFSKSMATNVFWPAWEWGPKRKPHLQYLSAAYSDALTERDNWRARTLMGHPEYEALWGDVFSFDKGDPDGRVKFVNNKKGHKVATSVKGMATGERGDRLIADDPHNVLQSESEAIMLEAIKWFTEAWPTRTNDEDAAFIVIMQRVHENDIANLCVELGFTHLCIPMRFEDDHPHRWFGGGHIAHQAVRAAVEKIEAEAKAKGEELSRGQAYDKFLMADDYEDVVAQPGYIGDGEQYLVSHAPQYGKGDPRQEDGELAFPELFTPERVARQERKMKIRDVQYAISGQLQQRPVPRGGGEITRDCIIWVEAKDVPAGGTPVVAGWDLAGSTGKKSPYTSVTVGKYGPDGVLYIMYNHSERIDAGKIDEHIKTKAVEFRELHRFGRVKHSLPQDPGQAGKYQKQAVSKKLRGHWFRFSSESGDKVQRFKPVLSQFQAKNVRLVRGLVSKKYVDNLLKFPAGRYKDDADSTSRMDMELTTQSGKDSGSKLTKQHIQIHQSDEDDIESTFGLDDVTSDRHN